jgi:hypothetical protein
MKLLLHVHARICGERIGADLVRDGCSLEHLADRRDHAESPVCIGAHGFRTGVAQTDVGDASAGTHDEVVLERAVLGPVHEIDVLIDVFEDDAVVHAQAEDAIGRCRCIDVDGTVVCVFTADRHIGARTDQVHVHADRRERAHVLAALLRSRVIGGGLMLCEDIADAGRRHEHAHGAGSGDERYVGSLPTVGVVDLSAVLDEGERLGGSHALAAVGCVAAGSFDGARARTEQHEET